MIHSASMAKGPANQFEKSPALWWIVAVLVGLNLWFDYYHPVWLFIDAIVVIVLIVKWPRAPKNPWGSSQT
jgi:membrane protein YdbS with pleckstrin-like domain